MVMKRKRVRVIRNEVLPSRVVEVNPDEPCRLRAGTQHARVASQTAIWVEVRNQFHAEGYLRQAQRV